LKHSNEVDEQHNAGHNSGPPSSVNLGLAASPPSELEDYQQVKRTFSLGLPPIKRKKFPYYPYGLIKPKCKPIIQGTKNRKKCTEKVVTSWTDVSMKLFLYKLLNMYFF
jgi:hypothetical protein